MPIVNRPAHELAVRERLTTFQKITSYQLPTFSDLPVISGDDIYHSEELPQYVNPLIEQDRAQALEKVNELLAKINKIKTKYELEQDSMPVCPYEQTKIKYLGKNYIAPSIQDLPAPINFSVDAAVSSNLLIGKHLHERMTTQLELMSAEAVSPDFSGRLSEVLGHAFTMLSTAPNGEQVRVVDNHKAALHLEFAEIVRNIPITYIIENPVLVAQKLISRYIDINKDSLNEQLLMITE